MLWDAMWCSNTGFWACLGAGAVWWPCRCHQLQGLRQLPGQGGAMEKGQSSEKCEEEACEHPGWRKRHRNLLVGFFVGFFCCCFFLLLLLSVWVNCQCVEKYQRSVSMGVGEGGISACEILQYHGNWSLRAGCEEINHSICKSRLNMGKTHGWGEVTLSTCSQQRCSHHSCVPVGILWHPCVGVGEKGQTALYRCCFSLK